MSTINKQSVPEVTAENKKTLPELLVEFADTLSGCAVLINHNYVVFYPAGLREKILNTPEKVTSEDLMRLPAVVVDEIIKYLREEQRYLAIKRKKELAKTAVDELADTGRHQILDTMEHPTLPL